MTTQSPHGQSARRLPDVPVLIVEDDPAGARMFSALFESEGAIVRVAPDGEEGLALLRDFTPRVLVVDLVLPLMSGLVFVQHVKGMSATADAIVIAVSALNGPRLEAIARECGCSTYLRKPVDVEHLVHLVISLLKGKS